MGERVGGWLRLVVDGSEVLKYQDYIPLRGARVGLYSCRSGLHVRRFRVFSRGVPATLSCLEVPNAFHGEEMIEKARAEYLRVTESHPGREEGLEALFFAGRCGLEMARGQAES